MTTCMTHKPDLATGAPMRSRRRMPIALRIFVAILVLATAANVVFVGIPAYRQYVAIREVERADGALLTEPRGSAWLRGILGGFWTKVVLDRVVGANLNSSRADDSTLRHLKHCTDLNKLALVHTRVTDAGLAHLEGLTGLEVVHLNGTQVTDAGLAHLAGLHNLRELLLNETSVSDHGMANLSGLDNLTYLQLIGTAISDDGLAHVSGMSKLSLLYLGNTRVTDRGLTHLRGLTNLTILSLGKTAVTDAGISELERVLPELRIQHQTRRTSSNRR